MEEEEVVKLGFIHLIGEETDGYYRYQFIFTNNIDEFWGENFDQKPCCLVNGLMPNEEYIYEVHIVKMKIKLDGKTWMTMMNIQRREEYSSSLEKH